MQGECGSVGSAMAKPTEHGHLTPLAAQRDYSNCKEGHGGRSFHSGGVPWQ